MIFISASYTIPEQFADRYSELKLSKAISGLWR